MITMEDNKRKFKMGDTVELIKDIDEFKKGSLFIVISNIRIRGINAVTVKSKLDNQYYWIYDNELKLYESNDGKGNKREFKEGDIVELIEDIELAEADSSSTTKFKKGSLFAIISNTILWGFYVTKAKSRFNNKEYWICNNKLKLYELNNEEKILKNFSNDHEIMLPKSYFDRELTVGRVLKNRFKDIEKSNKKDSNDTLTLSQVLKELADEWQEQDLKKLKKNNISKDKNTKSKFNIKPMNIIINRGLFKGQRCEIISEEDKTYTIRLLNDENSNAIKINKSDLYAQNEHEPEEGRYCCSVYRYKITGNKTILMDENNKILTSTICDESDIFDKNKALEICRHKHLIKLTKESLQNYQKELNKLINE